MGRRPFVCWVLVAFVWLLGMGEEPSWAAKELHGSPPAEEMFKEFDRIKEEAERLLKDLDLGAVTKKEALKALAGLRGTLQDLRGRLATRLWKERPGSARRKLLEEGLATLNRLDQWLADLQRQWEQDEGRWI